MAAKGIDFEVIKVESSTRYIYSDKAGRDIGTGFHYGIKIDDMVYDNLTPKGMKYDDWLKDLGAGYPGISYGPVNEIKNY